MIELRTIRHSREGQNPFIRHSREGGNPFTRHSREGGNPVLDHPLDLNSFDLQRAKSHLSLAMSWVLCTIDT